MPKMRPDRGPGPRAHPFRYRAASGYSFLQSVIDVAPRGARGGRRRRRCELVAGCRPWPHLRQGLAVMACAHSSRSAKVSAAAAPRFPTAALATHAERLLSREQGSRPRTPERRQRLHEGRRWDHGQARAAHGRSRHGRQWGEGRGRPGAWRLGSPAERLMRVWVVGGPGLKQKPLLLTQTTTRHTRHAARGASERPVRAKAALRRVGDGLG